MCSLSYHDLLPLSMSSSGLYENPEGPMPSPHNACSPASCKLTTAPIFTLGNKKQQTAQNDAHRNMHQFEFQPAKKERTDEPLELCNNVIFTNRSRAESLHSNNVFRNPTGMQSMNSCSPNLCSPIFMSARSATTKDTHSISFRLSGKLPFLLTSRGRRR